MILGKDNKIKFGKLIKNSKLIKELKPILPKVSSPITIKLKYYDVVNLNYFQPYLTLFLKRLL